MGFNSGFKRLTSLLTSVHLSLHKITFQFRYFCKDPSSLTIPSRWNCGCWWRNRNSAAVLISSSYAVWCPLRCSLSLRNRRQCDGSKSGLYAGIFQTMQRRHRVSVAIHTFVHGRAVPCWSSDSLWENEIFEVLLAGVSVFYNTDHIICCACGHDF